MPKNQGHGQARTLNTEQLDSIADACPPHIRAVCQTCRYPACRISEALALEWANVGSTDIVIPKRKTKGKLKTRTIPLHPRLSEELSTWRIAWAQKYGREPAKEDPIFPGRNGPPTTLSRFAMDRALRKACGNVGIDGVSLHSFRRSSLTAANDAGIHHRVLCELSGHSSMDMLSRYLDVKDSQKREAALAFG